MGWGKIQLFKIGWISDFIEKVTAEQHTWKPVGRASGQRKEPRLVTVSSVPGIEGY